MRLENDIREWGASTDKPDNSPYIMMVHDQLGAGEILIPGGFKIGAPLSILGGRTLVGVGQKASSLSTTDDMPAVIFEDSTGFAGMKNMSVFGVQSSNAQHDVVTVRDNQPVILRDLCLWGGNFALRNNGIDGYVENVYTNGCGRNGGGVVSQGANWYVRCKLDQAPQPVGFAFYQAWPIPQSPNIAENHFDQCDFSGAHDHSVFIDDAGSGSAVTVFSGSVFANKILINSAKWTCFNTCEFGGEILLNNTSGGYLTIGDSFCFSPTGVGGGSKKLKISNTVNMADV